MTMTTANRFRALRRWWGMGLTAGAVVVTVVLIAVRLAGGEDGAQQAATTDSTPATALAAAAPSSQAQAPVSRAQLTVPDVQLRAVAWQGSHEFVLSKNTDKPTIMEFTASWCVSCVPTLKALAQLEREMGDQINIVVMSIDPTDTDLAMQRLSEAAGGAPGIWAMDKGNVVTKAYNIRAVGVAVIVASGREIYRGVGAKSPDQLRAALAKAQQARQ